MEWIRRLSNALEYIERNLSSEISYEEAAKIACCSTYYFQRMFSYVAGISLSEYIRRRRMTQAAFELQSTDARVLEVALKYGYTSPTAFNRAFQSVHGIPPTAARIKGCILNSYLPIKFSIKVEGGDFMQYRIEEKAAMRIVGLRVPLTEDMEENKRIVPPFWTNLMQDNRFMKICEMSNQLPYGVLGITAYQNPKEIYYYIAASTDKPIPVDMFEYKIPAATWVIFECNGRFKESIQGIFSRFLMEWLPFSGYTYAELPDIEVYPIHSNGQQEGHSEVWIAIKKEKEC